MSFREIPLKICTPTQMFFPLKKNFSQITASFQLPLYSLNSARQTSDIFSKVVKEQRVRVARSILYNDNRYNKNAPILSGWIFFTYFSFVFLSSSSYSTQDAFYSIFYTLCSCYLIFYFHHFHKKHSGHWEPNIYMLYCWVPYISLLCFNVPLNQFQIRMMSKGIFELIKGF